MASNYIFIFIFLSFFNKIHIQPITLKISHLNSCEKKVVEECNSFIVCTLYIGCAVVLQVVTSKLNHKMSSITLQWFAEMQCAIMKTLIS